MSDLRELYQDMIMDHGRYPRNKRALTPATHQAQGFNQFCGDQLTLYLNIQNNIIQDITFTGSGCAISIASASLLCETLQGKTEPDAEILFQTFHQLLTQEETQHTTNQNLAKLAVFSGVKAYPLRVKCATLAWHTLRAALAQQQALVSTEE